MDKPECFVCREKLLHKSLVSLEKQAEKKYEHDEHIIPNAIGGKLISRKILCTACGEDFGKKIDEALAQHCLNFSNLLNVKRDRGNNQNIITEKKHGEKVALSPNGRISPIIHGKPIVKLNSEGKPERIIARSAQELKMYEGILKKDFSGFPYTKRKEDILEEDTLNIKHEISADAYRGVCKIAIEYYLHIGGKKENIIHLIPYLKATPSDAQFPIHLYYPSSCLNINSEVFHLIHLKGINKHRVLYAYIILFGVSAFFVALNWGDYGGEDFEYNYKFNILNSKEVKVEFFDFNLAEVNSFLDRVEKDFKNNLFYLFREDMGSMFMKEVKKFEDIVMKHRDDIKFKNPDIL